MNPNKKFSDLDIGEKFFFEERKEYLKIEPHKHCMSDSVQYNCLDLTTFKLLLFVD